MNESDLQLIKKTLNELASSAGHSQLNTKSISLLFLDFGLNNDDFEEMFISFNQIVFKNEEYNLQMFREILRKYIPNCTDLTVIRFIDGFAKNYIPELLLFSEEIKTDFINR